MKRNPFELLSLTASFEVDEAELHAAYQAKLRQFHPDLFANRTKKEQLMATQVSAEIVDAYATLKNPVSRATWLLNNAGGTFDLNEPDVSAPPEMLFEQIQFRESLEDATTPADKAAIYERIQVAYEDAIASFKMALKSAAFLEAKHAIIQMQFCYKLLEDKS